MKILTYLTFVSSSKLSTIFRSCENQLVSYVKPISYRVAVASCHLQVVLADS